MVLTKIHVKHHKMDFKLYFSFDFERSENKEKTNSEDFYGVENESVLSKNDGFLHLYVV